jgi:hypothetical protein
MPTHPIQNGTDDYYRSAAAVNSLCGGSVSSDRFFGFLGEEIVQLVVVVAVEM